MPVDEDAGAGRDAARARLEAIAYGADSSTTDAAAARSALAGLSAPAGAPALAGSEGRPSPDAQDAPDDSHGAAGSDTAAVLPPASRPTSGSAAGPLRTWRSRLGERRVLLSAALVVTALAAFGAGTAVGTVRAGDQVASAGSAADSEDGALTLSQLLAMPQTFADQLPGSIEAPVRLHSTRLVYTNKSLSADDAQTPWDVYAAVGNDDDTICLVATADGLTSSQSCFPRAAALSGSVVLVAQSRSGILAVRVESGIVHGRVAPSP